MEHRLSAARVRFLATFDRKFQRAFATIPTRLRMTQTKLTRSKILAIAAVVVLVVGGGVLADYWSARPVDAVATFVGRSSCLDCHQDQAEKFAHSHHDLAMDIATDQTVLGDFDDVTFEHDGLTNRMFRNGEKFMVHTEGPDGRMQDFQVKYVFGVDPLQQYMVEFDRTPDMKPGEIGRLQVLRISWDVHGKKWFYLRPPDVSDKLEPSDPLHWTGIAQRWQTMCADCHSTNLKTNFNVATNRYHTTYSEIDVSCEACHGPGSMHVELANAKSLFWDRHHGYGLAKLKGDDIEPQLQTCAPCHSRRGLIDPMFTAGRLFTDHYNLELLNPDTYYPDGQIKDEVYVYGSFTQSKMYHKGIRCTDCHDPHSLQLKHPGNETCTSCHQHSAGKYDVPSHHHHAPGTPGSMCVDCHMPHRTYMDVDPRRDHSLRIPRPDLSVKLGTPNACSGCHVNDQMNMVEQETRAKLNDYQSWLDAAENGNESVQAAITTTDQWCDDACAKWYGADRKTPYHFAEAIAAFRRGEADAVQRMLSLVSMPEDAAPGIARATALAELGQHNVSDTIQLAATILKDQDEPTIVRAAAVGVFAIATPNATKRALLPMLDDPIRLIRNEAARVLVSSGAYQELNPSEKTRVDLSLRSVHDALMAASDRAGAHMAWAMLCEQQGRASEAIEAYETAMRLEPMTTGPRTNLASLLDRIAEEQRQQGQTATAMKSLARAQALRDEELPFLKRDALLAPDNADVQYRYGLALYLHGDETEALAQLEKAVELQPEVELFQTAVRLLKEKLAQ